MYQEIVTNHNKGFGDFISHSYFEKKKQLKTLDFQKRIKYPLSKIYFDIFYYSQNFLPFSTGLTYIIYNFRDG